MKRERKLRPTPLPVNSERRPNKKRRELNIEKKGMRFISHLHFLSGYSGEKNKEEKPGA